MTLTVAELACRRGGRDVFRGLSFSVAPGEVRLLRGPNGAGKTTLLRTLAGLIPAAAGAVALDGLALGADADIWAERIAYVGHLDAIKPQLTVAENLEFWAALNGARGIAPAVEAFDLGGIAGRPAHACSAGQKRRAGLARLMLAPRRLWLLDEPTSALDAASVARLEAVLRRHAASGGTALVATHVALAAAAGEPVVLAPPDPQAAAHDPFLADAIA